MLPENVKNGAGAAIGTLAKACSAPAKAVNAGSGMAMQMAADLTGGAPMPDPFKGNPLAQLPNMFSSRYADPRLGQLPSPDAPDVRGPDQRCR